MNNFAEENIGFFMDTPLWVQVWQMKKTEITVFAAFLIIIILLMIFKNRLSRSRKTLAVVQYSVLLVSFLYVGLFLKAQPTSTNIVILFNSLKGLRFPLELFMLEPYIFLSFIFIGITLVLWGRGVFCGWLCPYGAMLELLNKIYDKFSRFRFVIPEKIHSRLVYLKYFIFLLIAGVSFYSFILSEYLTEVEPFRTFVLKLNREWYFVFYFVILTVGSVLVYRGFCRYICPLGALIALPSMFRRMHIVKLKRYDFCTQCKICRRSCSYQAVTDKGAIASSECFYCLDCQLNYWDQDICPVLIREKKQLSKKEATT